MNSTADISFRLSDLSPELLAQFQQRLQQLQGAASQHFAVALKIGQEPELGLPEALVKFLLQVLQPAVAGKTVVLADADAEILPEKAAALGHVSQPFWM